MTIWSTEIKELETLYESLKGQLPELEKELEQLIHTSDANVIMLYSRRCLEVIITDLCKCELKRPRKTEPLKGIIDKLYKEEKVPSHIMSSMHGLNELSTYGTHPKDFDPEQVKPVLNNLAIIIKWYLKYKNIVAINKTEGQAEKVVSRDGLFKEEKKEVRKEVQEKPDKLHKNKVFLNSIFILVVLAIAATFLYPKIFKKDTLERLRSSGERISVAVMPFQNMTGDTTKNILQGWIQDNLTNLLSNSEELKVKKTESVSTIINSKGITTNASITPSLAGSISRKLDANIFIYGSIKKDAATFRLSAQLIDSKTEVIFKFIQINVASKKDITNKIIDSLSVMVKDYLEVFKLKKESPTNLQGMLSTVNSPEAYRYFIAGKKAFEKRDYPTTIYNLSKAIEIDTNFIYAPILLAQAYSNVGRYEDGKKLMLKQYKKRDQMSYQMRTYTDFEYATYFETPDDKIRYLKQLLEIDDQSPDYHYLLASSYFNLYQFDKALPELEKALEINKKWGTKPWWVINYTALGYCYHITGQYRKEERIYKKAEKDFPDDPALIYMQAILALTEKNTNAANDYIEKYKSILKEKSASEAVITTNLAGIYEEAGILNKAEEFYRQTLTLEPENPFWLYNLAWFLIDKDRNIDEGLKLIDKALEISPNNYYMVDTKGWGLYKKGKYKEALEFLQKADSLKPVYVHVIYLHLEAAKKAVAGQKNN
jgi:tetratricopeptide (TPR) repeat protein